MLKYYLSLLLMFLSFINYQIFSPKNIFSWPTITDLSLMLKIKNDSLFINDYLVNALLKSPKYFYAYCLNIYTNLFSYFGFDWEMSIYILQVFLSILYIPLIFLVISSVLSIWKPKNIDNQTFNFVILAAFFIVLFYQHILCYYYLPAGIRPINYFSFFLPKNPIVYSLHFAHVTSMFFIINALSDIRKFNVFALFLLIFISFVHPVFSIHLFVFYLIVIAPKYFIRSLDLKYFIFGVLIPIFIHRALNNVENPMNSEDFVSFYAGVHPMHYMMSEVVGYNFLFWSFLFFTLIFLSFQIGNKAVFSLSILSSLSFIIVVLLQYFFTELYPNKIISIISPNRFHSLCLILFIINFLIIFMNIINQKFNFALKSINFFDKSRLIIIMRLLSENAYSQKKIITAFIFLSIIIYCKRSYVPYPGKDNFKSMINWVKSNTKSDDVFLVLDKSMKTSYMIRLFAERASFWDKTFPVNEDYYEEYNRRKNFINIVKTDGIKKSMHQIKTDSIDYILKHNNYISDDTMLLPIYKNYSFTLYNTKYTQ